MHCCIGCLALAAPRLAIILVAIFSDFIGRAYDSLIWPLLGFFFMPLTTLAYAWAINVYGEARGLGLVIVIVAVLVDLGLIGGSSRTRWRNHRGRSA